MVTIRPPFLYKKLNILVVDDEDCILDTFQEYLNDYPLYNATTASSIEIAEKYILEKKKRWHACILDLGMSAPDLDEFYLLKKYNTKIPFIIVSGSHSIAKGSKAKSLGAFEAIDKPFLLDILINTINNAIIWGIFLYDTSSGRNETVDKANQMLFSSDISTISEWSFKCCISDSNHRKLWHSIYGVSPKKMFAAYRMLKIAIDSVNSEIKPDNNEAKKDSIQKNKNEIKNLKRFYYQNIKFFLKYF